MGAVTVGAVGGEFVGIDARQKFIDADLEFRADLTVVVQQGVAVLLRPLACGTQDETGNGVQFIGDGTESQASCFKGDRAASGGDVED